MMTYRQALLIAVCENNTQQLYENLNQLRPEDLLPPKDLPDKVLVLAGKLAKKTSWEGVFLFNAILLKRFRCPQMIYSEIHKKLSPSWQRHLPQPILVQQFSEQEYSSIANNLIRMSVKERITLLTGLFNNDLHLENGLIWRLLMYTSIAVTKNNCMSVLIGLLENHPFNIDIWYSFFVFLVEHETLQFGKVLLMHLMENPHFKKEFLASLPWGRWLEKPFIGSLLNQHLYLRLQFLGFSLTQQINQMAIQNPADTKIFLRRLSLIGCQLQDPLFDEKLRVYFNHCFSQMDGHDHNAFSLIQALLKADYCRYPITSPYSLEFETDHWLRELTSLKLLIHTKSADIKTTALILARPDRPITKQLFTYLDKKSIATLATLCKTFYQNISPHLQQYPPQIALDTLLKMHLEWINRVDELQEMQQRKGFRNPLIQFCLTPALIVACGIAVCVARFQEDKKNQYLQLILILAGLGSLMGAVLLTLIYRLIFTSPLINYFPSFPQKYLSFSPDFTADFYIKLVQLEVLRIDLLAILETLQQHNPMRINKHSASFAALYEFNLSGGRLTNCINSQGLFKRRWLHLLCEELVSINPRLIRKRIRDLHQDLNQCDIRWGKELNRGSDTRQILETYQPNFFRTNPSYVIEHLETERTPLVKSSRSVKTF